MLSTVKLTFFVASDPRVKKASGVNIFQWKQPLTPFQALRDMPSSRLSFQSKSMPNGPNVTKAYFHYPTDIYLN